MKHPSYTICGTHTGVIPQFQRRNPLKDPSTLIAHPRSVLKSAELLPSRSGKRGRGNTGKMHASSRAAGNIESARIVVRRTLAGQSGPSSVERSRQTSGGPRVFETRHLSVFYRRHHRPQVSKNAEHPRPKGTHNKKRCGVPVAKGNVEAPVRSDWQHRPCASAV